MRCFAACYLDVSLLIRMRFNISLISNSKCVISQCWYTPKGRRERSITLFLSLSLYPFVRILKPFLAFDLNTKEITYFFIHPHDINATEKKQRHAKNGFWALFLRVWLTLERQTNQKGLLRIRAALTKSALAQSWQKNRFVDVSVRVSFSEAKICVCISSRISIYCLLIYASARLN